MKWQPIETCNVKDGTPILGWCVHSEDAYQLGDGKLTLYGAHTEGLSHVEDGAHVLIWGGAINDCSWEEPNGTYLPDWWFRFGSEFEETANPILWQSIVPPNLDKSKNEITRDILQLNLEPIPEYAHIMTEQEWKSNVRAGAYCSCDGSGYWATDRGMDPNADAFDNQPDWATHVAWFNK